MQPALVSLVGAGPGHPGLLTVRAVECLREADLVLYDKMGPAAFAGIPLTHRHHASAVAFFTGHENPDKPDSALDWSALARFPGTLVVYMGMSRLDKIAQALIDEGKDPHCPAAAVQHATSG